MSDSDAISRHYASTGLLARIEDGLRKAGKGPETVTIDDLAPVDEFHLRAAAATTELIAWLDPKPGARVLDLGAGLGGPARRLANARRCMVTGIDLSEEFCATGTALNAWVGLDRLVRLVPGDATRLDGVAAHAFDAAWTIHVGMNIADKPAFYGEVARVLKPGGRFVLFDVLAANGQPEIEFPVPWAKVPEASFLATLDAMTAHLDEAGFIIEQTLDHTAAGLAFLDQAIARASQLSAPAPLGLHLILGPAFAQMVPNMRKNLAEGRMRLTAMQCRKST